MLVLSNLRTSICEYRYYYASLDVLGNCAALVTTFNLEIGITGAILTKLDGDSRGGAALSVKEVSFVNFDFWWLLFNNKLSHKYFIYTSKKLRDLKETVIIIYIYLVWFFFSTVQIKYEFVKNPCNREMVNLPTVKKKTTKQKNTLYYAYHL